jgi:hypothetical protein
MRHWLRKLSPDHAAIDDNRWLRPFRNTLLHPRLWHLNRRSAAGGVAAGLFFGMFPAPFQMLGAALCAVFFRVNLPIAVLTTLYTNPLTFPPLYLLAWWIGSRLLGSNGSFLPPPEFDFATIGPWLDASLAWLSQLGAALALGVLLLASVFAVVGYGGVRLAWRIWLVRHWRRRRLRHVKTPVAQ